MKNQSGRMFCTVSFAAFIFSVFLFTPADGDMARAIELTLELSGLNAGRIECVGVIQRWDTDGNNVRKLDTQQKIGSPDFDAVAEREAGEKWIFHGLKPGRYDIVLLGTDFLRIDGYDYPPVLEFDPFISGMSATAPAIRRWVANDIVRARHYENIVRPLTVGDDRKSVEDDPKAVMAAIQVPESELDPHQKVRIEEGEADDFDDGSDDTVSATRPSVVRILVMLIRDEETSFEGEMAGAATIRHEVWQYTYRHGGYQKEKRTRVFDRAILPRDELRRRTWLWDPQLGGILLTSEGDSRTIRYAIPDLKKGELPGLRPSAK